MLFTVDWEPIFSYRAYGSYWEKKDPMIVEPTYYLLDLLKRHQIKAIFYIVGWLKDKYPVLFEKIKNDGHIMGDHTYYHALVGDQAYQSPFRAPRWRGEKRLYSGGFWLRAMPYWWIKKEVEKTGVFFIHPHDVLFEHPDCGNVLKTFERRIGLKTSRDKLERLVREIKFEDPEEYLYASAG